MRASVRFREETLSARMSMPGTTGTRRAMNDESNEHKSEQRAVSFKHGRASARTRLASEVQVLELGEEERLLEHAEQDHRADPILKAHQVAPVEAQHGEPRDRHQHVQHRYAHVELEKNRSFTRIYDYYEYSTLI